MRILKGVIICGGFVLAACSDQGSPPTAPARHPVASHDGQGAPLSGVGTFGIVEAISKSEKKLQLRQLGFDFTSVAGHGGKLAKDSAAVGGKHQLLQVQMAGGDSTRLYRKGGESIFDGFEVGDTVLVLGRVTGGALHADLVSDFAGLGEPVDSITSKLPADDEPAVFVPDPIALALTADPLSRCFGHNITYGPNTH